MDEIAEITAHVAHGDHVSIPIGDGKVCHLGIFLPRHVIEQLLRVSKKQNTSVSHLIAKLSTIADTELLATKLVEKFYQLDNQKLIPYDKWVDVIREFLEEKA